MARPGATVSAFAAPPAASMTVLLFASSRFCIRSTASFSARGNSGAGSPNFVPAFNPPHASSVKNELLCGIRNLALPKLPPDLCRRLGQNWIHQRRHNANSLRSRCQHPRLQRSMVRVLRSAGFFHGAFAVR